MFSTVSRNWRTMVCLVLVAATSSFATAGVVTQYSFEDNLLDTGVDGLFVDDLISYNTALDPTPANFELGVIGQAVRVGLADGQASVLVALDSDDLDLATDYTVEMFILPQPEQEDVFNRLAVKWFGGSNAEWHFSLQYANDGLDLFANGLQILNGAETADVPTHEWSHVAFTGDSVAGETTLWLNGVAVGTAPYVAVVPGTAPLELGNISLLAGDTWAQYSGLMDEVAIHNTAQDVAYMSSRAGLLPDTLVWDNSDSN